MPAPAVEVVPAVPAPAPAQEKVWVYEELPAVPPEDFSKEAWECVLALEAIGEGLKIRDRRMARSYRTALERGRRIHGVWLGWLREAVGSYAEIENNGKN